MTNPTEILTAIVNKSPLDLEAAFSGAMADKITDLLDERKLELAKELYGSAEDPDEDDVGEEEFDDLDFDLNLDDDFDFDLDGEVE